MKPTITLCRALSDPAVLGHVLAGPSWTNWRALLLALAGEPLTAAECEIWQRFTGRPTNITPRAMAREAAFVCGRRAGKDRAISVFAAWVAACCEHPELVPGETGVVLIVAPDKTQAEIQRGYILAALEGSPMLSGEVESSDAESITLRNGIKIVVRAASFRRLRGATAVCIIATESAFWHDENRSVNPDTEIMAALKPMVLTTGGPVIQISSPHAKTGVLWDLHRQHHGPQGDPGVMVVQAATRLLNPTARQDEIERAYAADRTKASAEYGAEFLDGVSGFIPRSIVESCAIPDRRELPPRRDTRYFAYVDSAGGAGTGDSMCLAIGHREGDTVIVDAIREQVPPFSPDATVSEFVALLERYGVGEVTGDNWGSGFVQEQFTRRGIGYRLSDKTTSALYLELLPALNARTIELLDHPKAIDQIASLERHVGSGGRDKIDHGRYAGAHDDVAAVVAGLNWIAGVARDQQGAVLVGTYGMGGPISWQDERQHRTRFRIMPRSESDREAERRRDAANAEHNRRFR